ncbi:hypothetical protein PMAYCL1PPCAC_09278, partial [Pristionchus mayeri]
DFGYFLTSSSEFAIVIERLIACIKQRIYDQHGFAHKIMAPVIIFISIFAAVMTICLYWLGLFIPTIIFSQCLGYATAVLAFFCHRYSDGSYRNLMASTLSTKYQIREVSVLTHALVLITFGSVIIKLLIAAEIWCEFILRLDLP